MRSDICYTSAGMPHTRIWNTLNIDEIIGSSLKRKRNISDEVAWWDKVKPSLHTHKTKTQFRHTHVHTHTYIYIHIYTYINIYIYIYIYIYIFLAIPYDNSK